MRTYLLIGLLLFIGFGATQAWAQSVDLDRVISLEAGRTSKRLAAPALADRRAENIDITRHVFHLRLDPNKRYIEGSVSTRFRWKGPDFNTLYFDLRDTMLVDSVFYQGVSLVPNRSELDVIKINLPAGTRPSYDSVRVVYHGTPPRSGSGFGSFVQAKHGNTNTLWTLSEPYGARDWWPSKQDLRDKIDTVDMYAEIPVGNKVGGNGLLRSVTPSKPNWQVYHWQSLNPIACYLISFAVTNYAEYTYRFKLRGDSLLYQNYIFPENLTADNKLKIDLLVPVVRLFDSLYGPYPFKNEKYGHAQFGWGGGQEHQTMSSVNGFDLSLTAHELAHQWFGDHVTCGAWADIWLNEAFATYSEGISRYFTGRTADWLTWKSQVYNYNIQQKSGSVYIYDTTSSATIFTALPYYRGAYVLHNLRWLLGDAAFFKALRDYHNDPTLANGFARTPDLQRHFEQASGKQIGEYLQDYLYHQGFPQYTITYNQTAADPVSIQISQVPTHPSVSFFENRVPLVITYLDNTKDTIALDNAYNVQQYSVPVRGRIGSVTYDPMNWVLGTGKVVKGPLATAGMIENRWRISPNPTQGWIEISGPQGAQATVSVFSSSGALLKKAKPENSRFSLEGLAPGAYMVSLELNDHQELHRVVLGQ